MTMIVNTEIHTIMTPENGISLGICLGLYSLLLKNIVSERIEGFLTDNSYLWNRGKRGYDPEFNPLSKKFTFPGFKLAMHTGALAIMSSLILNLMGSSDLANRFVDGLLGIMVIATILTLTGVMIDGVHNWKYRRRHHLG